MCRLSHVFPLLYFLYSNNISDIKCVHVFNNASIYPSARPSVHPLVYPSILHSLQIIVLFLFFIVKCSIQRHWAFTIGQHITMQWVCCLLQCGFLFNAKGLLRLYLKNMPVVAFAWVCSFEQHTYFCMYIHVKRLTRVGICDAHARLSYNETSFGSF